MSVNKVNSDGSLQRIAGGTLYADAPIGTISPFGGSVVPNGYLLCNGAEVLKTTYAELYAVIGDAFGTASANTKFVLPDLRGEFLRGAGTNSHTSQGNGGVVGEHQDATTVPHIYSNSGPNNVNIAGKGTTTNLDSVPSGTNYYQTINSGDHGTGSSYNFGTVRPTNTSVNYIIKAKQVAVPADFKDAIDDVLKVSEPVSATNTEYITNGSIVWKRSGNVVEVTFFNVAFTSQTSGDVALATGLPPSKNYSWSVINSLTNANVQQGVAVNTDGTLTSIGGSTGGSSYYDSFTYLAAD